MKVNTVFAVLTWVAILMVVADGVRIAFGEHEALVGPAAFLMGAGLLGMALDIGYFANQRPPLVGYYSW